LKAFSAVAMSPTAPPDAPDFGQATSEMVRICLSGAAKSRIVFFVRQQIMQKHPAYGILQRL